MESPPVINRQPSEDTDGRQGQIVDKVDGGPKGCAGTIRPVVCLGRLVVALLELAQVLSLHAVGPNSPLAADALLGKAV